MNHAILRTEAGPDLFALVQLEGLRRFLLPCMGFLLPWSKVVELGGGKLVNFSVADVLLPLVMMLLGWRFLTSGLRLPYLPLFLLVQACVCVSALLNMELAMSWRGPVATIVELFKMLSLWIYYYAFVNLIENRRDVLTFLRAWIASSVVVGGLGIYGSLVFQYGGMVTPFALHFRAQGTFDDANLFAMHMTLSLFLTIVLGRMEGRQSWWQRAAMLVHFLAIVFSASRGSLLALMLALSIFWFLFSPLNVRICMVALVLFVVGMFFMLPDREELLRGNSITERLTTTTVDLNNPEAQQRRGLWEAAYATWRQHPLFGIGRGNYGIDPKWGPGIAFAHNTYLGLLAELGLMGFLGLACFAAAHGWQLLRLLGGRLAFASGALLAGAFAIALDGVTINIENYRGLWALLAFMSVWVRLAPTLLQKEEVYASAA
jgi:O-antigen ligase